MDEAGEEQVIGFHLPGELIGLDALGSGTHRCEAVALNTGGVCELPFRDLVAIAGQLPSLQQQLLRVIGQSVGRDHEHMDMLVRRQAHERVAAFLHGLAQRLQHIGQSETHIVLPMGREDIARFLGLALETVSRGFSRLQYEGLIAVNGRRVEVLEMVELTRLARSPGAPTRRHAARAPAEC